MAGILLADDDDPLREMLAVLLRQQGYTVVEARNGSEALAKFTAAPADLVITDLFMPEMGGIDLIMALRKDYPALRIMAMSGSPRCSAYLRTAESLGANRAIRKPFQTNQLIALVRELLAAAD